MSYYVLVDLDGTLCSTSHRAGLIDKGREGGPDWRTYSLACGDDPVIPGVAALVNLLALSVDVVYASGRDEAARQVTRAWLVGNGLPTSELRMRADGDHRDNVTVKCEWVEEMGPDRCVLAIDDFPAVLDALRERWDIPGLLVPSNDRRYDVVALERSGVLTADHLP